MDLDRLVGSSITSLTTEVSKDDVLTVRIGLGRRPGPGPDAVLVLSEVSRLCIDGDAFGPRVDKLILRRLPQFGPWPPEAHGLLWLHDNHTELVWLRLIGPAETEIVACDLRVEVEGGGTFTGDA